MKIEPIGNGLYGGTYKGRVTVVDIDDCPWQRINYYRVIKKPNPHFEVIKKLLYSYENN